MMGLEAAPADLCEAGARGYLHRGVIWHVTKRVFDIVIAGLGLLVTAPLFLAIAIVIKHDSPGPVFFRQVRVGKKRRPFAMWKFRKMPHDLPEQGPMLTARNDRRRHAGGSLARAHQARRAAAAAERASQRDEHRGTAPAAAVRGHAVPAMAAPPPLRAPRDHLHVAGQRPQRDRLRDVEAIARSARIGT